MNDAKNIYAFEQKSDVADRTLKLQSVPEPKLKKSVLARVIDFLSGPDLDLATFKRLEGIDQEPERDQRHRYMGVRI